ncbi:MAG: transcriptional regulator, family [Firmicutes bacterium]|nr:transcriptional regulator, family [Bacillota bacterium]
MINIPERIKELTFEKGLNSINELSRKADVPQSTLATIMRGQTSPRADTLNRICQALEVSMSEFFTETSLTKIIEHAEAMPLSEEQQVALKTLKNMSTAEQQQRFIKILNKLPKLSPSDLEASLKFIDYLHASRQKS